MEKFLYINKSNNEIKITFLGETVCTLKENKLLNELVGKYVSPSDIVKTGSISENELDEKLFLI